MCSSKTCFKCGSHLPLSEFYKHPKMGDGHLGKCKACAKKDVADHRKTHIESIREYEKNRSKLPHRKKLVTEIVKRWRQEDAKRVKCHNAVIRAIKKGKLDRLPCENCGEVKSQAHHEDYDKPLDVIWLCDQHHKNRHKQIKKES